MSAIRRVAGLGLRAQAPLGALREALEKAAGDVPPDALATLTTRARTPAMQALARETGLPLIAIAPEAIAGIVTLTASPRIAQSHKTGSVAEAVALVALGPQARLAAPRQMSSDGTATAAIATLLPESQP